MTNEMIEKEQYIAPEVEVYSLEVEGILCNSNINNGFGGEGDDFGGEFGSGFGRGW